MRECHFMGFIQYLCFDTITSDQKQYKKFTRQATLLPQRAEGYKGRKIFFTQKIS